MFKKGNGAVGGREYLYYTNAYEIEGVSNLLIDTMIANGLVLANKSFWHHEADMRVYLPAHRQIPVDLVDTLNAAAQNLINAVVKPVLSDIS